LKIKVLHVITGLGAGGAEFTLLQFLSNFDRDRFDFVVISLTQHTTLMPLFKAQGICVYSFDFKSSLSLLLQLIQLVRLIRKINPDVVHTWMYHSDLLGGIASRLAGVRRLVWGIHHSNLDNDKNSKSTLVVARICAWISGLLPDKISVCSQVAMNSHLNYGYKAGIDNYVVIHNGFNLKQFRPDQTARQGIRSELGIPNDAILFGMIARFHPQKDHLGFLQAAINVAERFPDTYFVLCGTGVDESNPVFRKCLNALGLRERLFLLGYRADVPRLFAALDVHVLCTYGEAFPNVLGEAMATGVPCIAADVGDCREILGDTGLVYQAGNVQEIIFCMESMLSSDRSELGQRARQRIVDHYSVDKMVNRYQLIYDRLIDV
jgi:glycosyltransferase involved in cell wall biosynthesis